MGHTAFFLREMGYSFQIIRETNKLNLVDFCTAMGVMARMYPTGGGQGIRIRFVKKIKNEYPLRDSGTEYGVHVGAGSRLLKYWIVIL